MGNSSLPDARLRVLELYAGIGGVSAALQTAVRQGWAEVVAAVDVHRGALAVHAHNFGTPTVVANLESIPASDYAAFDADLWWMSPPCQPFTRRGKRRDAEDPRAQGFLQFLDTVAQVRPRHLALENVPGFRGSQTHTRLRRTLKFAGYRMREWLLCPSGLGHPNRRRRFYLVASRTGFTESSTSPPEIAAPSSPSAGLQPYLDSEPEPDLAVAPELLERYRHAVDVVDAGDPQAVTATFTSAYGRSPVRSGSYLRQEDGTVRYFSPREVLRLLGFPDSYHLPRELPRAKAWRLVGNSLSLPPVRAVLGSLPELVSLRVAERASIAG